MVSIISSLSPAMLLIISVLYCQVHENLAVVEGGKAKPGDFPSIVSLRNETGRHYCGGTLVTRKHIVTAGHCLYTDDTLFLGKGPTMLKAENLKVVIGSLSVKEGGDEYEVDRVIPHPEYDVNGDSWFAKDVAVIVLKKEVDSSIVPTPIATTWPKNGTLGMAGGWGLLNLHEPKDDIIHQNDFPTDLQKFSATIIDKETCENEFKEKDGSPGLSEKEKQYVICAKPVVNNSGVCVRDSGSPLMIGGEFVGFVIGGKPCAKGYPDFYGSTAAHQDFINNAINAQS